MPRTVALLRDATSMLPEATPKGVDMDHVRRQILEAAGVADCHGLRAWTITSGMNVVSAHVVQDEGADPATALDAWAWPGPDPRRAVCPGTAALGHRDSSGERTA